MRKLHFATTLKILITMVLQTACSPVKVSRDSRFSDLSEARILTRMKPYTERPVWLEGALLDRQGASWLVLGYAITPERTGIESALVAAEKRARQEIRSEVEARLRTFVEISRVTPQPQEYEKLSEHLERALPAISHVRHEYWEQVPQKYRAFIRLEISQGDLKKVVLESSEHLKSRGQISPELSTLIQTKLDSLVSFDTHEVAPLLQTEPAGQN